MIPDNNVNEFHVSKPITIKDDLTVVYGIAILFVRTTYGRARWYVTDKGLVEIV